MPSGDSLLIGEILIEQGLITPQQLEISLEAQKKTGSFICTTLIEMGFAKEEEVFNVLAQQLKIPYVRIKNIKIDPAIFIKVPAKFASYYKIMPLEIVNNDLIIAMADPLDMRTLDDIRLLLNLEVKGVLASEFEIQEAICKYYGVGAETLERIIAQKPVEKKMADRLQEAQETQALAEDASIIKFVNQILSEAVKDRATDIHLEPFHNELRTRFRIDGVLYDVNIPETIRYFHPAIVSRIKIMSGLNIAERRLPQDGRMKVKVNGQELDLRVSMLPTIFGEAIQIRVLSSALFLELEKLGFAQEELRIIENVILRPHGIIFVTGPTGSGKSTTLYACLARINSQDRKIITIEDPVEYQLRGVNQLQVLPQIGFTFAIALRHMLRHDPDVMMVGEVRDHETAEIAIRSALTGHLVFSTLHTNDAAGAITRLLDMGIEPFLVSSSLECLIAQRLVRLICPACKVPLSEKSSQEIFSRLKEENAVFQERQLYEGRGCQECRFTGYHGRTAIHEILIVTESIRELILNRSSSQQIKQKAVAQGMCSLRQNGLQKVLDGQTTFTEVMRVTQQEEIL